MSIKVVDAQKCTGCLTCIDVCKKRAVKKEISREGFWFLSVDENMCINCGLCEKKCPALTEKGVALGEYLQNSIKAVTAYALKDKEIEQRLRSSSGGAFPILAQMYINAGGIVYGAAFDQEWRVHHVAIDRIEDIPLLQSSKYVQSDTTGVYSDIKRKLSEGKMVMFTGTPCQMAALHNYLGNKEYDQLLCVDVFCHGISAPGLFERYLNENVKSDKSNIEEISFRHKSNSWEKYNMYIKTNCAVYEIPYARDAFLKPFCRRLSLRESCYVCKSKGFPRHSDLTLGDFWMVDRVFPDMNDHKGVSLVLVNSDKGEKWLKLSERYAEIRKIDDAIFSDCYKHSGKPVPKPPEREAYFNTVRHEGTKKAAKAYGNLSLKFQITRFVRNVLISMGVYDNLRRMKRF